MEIFSPCLYSILWTHTFVAKCVFIGESELLEIVINWIIYLVVFQSELQQQL